MSKKLGLIIPHDYKLLSIAAILEVFETANKLSPPSEKPFEIMIFQSKEQNDQGNLFGYESNTIETSDIILDLILIPVGKFKMGDQGVNHEVTLTKPYYMGKYEVTQEQWEGVMGNNPSSTKGGKLPVTDVSWEDCQEFIRKLIAKTNGGYRLPSEAEWEYACRAGTTTAYSFGDNITAKDANYNIGIKILKPVAVGNYKPNAFGLYDMHGNVWEWCEDWKADYPAGAVTDPKGPATGRYRMLRGGSFNSVGSRARSSYRNSFSPTDRLVVNGFRLARTP